MGQRADSGRNASLDDKKERNAGVRGEVKPQVLKDQNRDRGGATPVGGAFGQPDASGTDEANNLSEGGGGGGAGPAPAKD